jgi:DNA-binding MarR family transcriptional regulator
MDKELIILEQIQNNPHVNQRDLATVAQASLGMPNAILKRFAAKGLITIKKVNNRNIRYALTPEGMDEITTRSWNYFKRTIKNVVDYQDAIMEIVIQARKEGYDSIALEGESDFAFIIEHACYKKDIPFLGNVSKGKDRTFCFIAESRENNLPVPEDTDCFFLNHLFLG